MRRTTTAAITRRCLRLWGRVVLKRDPVCVVCNKEPSKHPHHIFPRSRYRHLWFDLRNGVGLCIGDHYAAHFDPVRPVLRYERHFGDQFRSLVADALTGRRRNPYGKKELLNIELALRVALEEKG